MHDQRQALALFFISSAWSLGALARPSMDRALPYCENVDQELRQAQVRMSSEDRSDAVKKLLGDMQHLYAIKGEDNLEAKNFLNRCLKRKAEIYLAHRKEATQDLKSQYEFRMNSGKIFQLVGSHDQAYRYFMEAARQQPSGYQAYWEAYQSWNLDQSEKIRKGLGKNYGHAEKRAFLDQSRELLNPVLKNSQTPLDLKVAALRSRARFYDSIAFSREAFEDWKALQILKKDDIEALGRKAAFELEMQRHEDSLATLKTLIPLVPKNPRARAQRIQALLELRRVEDALIDLRAALRAFPNEAPLLALQVKALVIGGQSENATPSVKKLETMNYAGPELLFYYEKEGLSALSNGDEKRAFALIEKALKMKNDSTVGVEAVKKISLLAQPSESARHHFLKWAAPAIPKGLLGRPELQNLVRWGSQEPRIQMAACQELGSHPQFFDSLESLEACLQIFLAKGRGPQGRALIERALRDPAFEGHKNRLMQWLDKT